MRVIGPWSQRELQFNIFNNIVYTKSFCTNDTKWKRRNRKKHIIMTGRGGGGALTGCAVPCLWCLQSPSATENPYKFGINIEYEMKTCGNEHFHVLSVNYYKCKFVLFIYWRAKKGPLNYQINYQIYCVKSSRTCACDLNMGVIFHMRWALFEHFFVLHLVLFKFWVHRVFSCSAQFDLAALFNISTFRMLVITGTKMCRKEHIKQSQLVLSSVWNIFWVCGQVAPLTSSGS